MKMVAPRIPVRFEQRSQGARALYAAMIWPRCSQHCRWLSSSSAAMAPDKSIAEKTSRLVKTTRACTRRRLTA